MALPDRARRPRPWRRTRAYRLTRTVVLTVTLAVGGVWWARVDEPTPAPVTATDGTPVAPSTGNGGNAGTGRAARERSPAPTTPTPVAGPAKGRSEPAGPGPHTRPTRAAGPTEGRSEPDGPALPAAPTPAAGPAKGRPGSAGRTPPTAHPSAPATPRAPALLPRSRPTRLGLPYLDVEAPVVDLRLDRHGQLSAPPDNNSNLVGWYADGPSPGENGTVIVVGHRDTRAGPAVFVGLDEVTPGRRVELRRADGRTAVYTVYAVKTYDKANFPSREVYGARARPELRLITCGGGYDRRTGYTGNIVVYAHLTAT
ncbi:class F sortase [Streptomyces sp. SID12501]|uniref:Class F sortase n=1 Tax=Streptomyces sp. SID12501 TaxID=2706042 RepID=A0A6B3BY28_9ACTN|nr:class F sortase [Streptomyces sp. SID12501]